MNLRTITLTFLAGAALSMAGSPARADTWAQSQAAFDERDDARALVLLRLAAEEGDPRAQMAWGLALRHGATVFPGTTAKPEQARPWLSAAAAALARADERLTPAGLPAITAFRGRGR